MDLDETEGSEKCMKWFEGIWRDLDASGVV